LNPISPHPGRKNTKKQNIRVSNGELRIVEPSGGNIPTKKRAEKRQAYPSSCLLEFLLLFVKRGPAGGGVFGAFDSRGTPGPVCLLREVGVPLQSCTPFEKTNQKNSLSTVSRMEKGTTTMMSNK